MDISARLSKIEGLSVRLTNQCNLKCIMCSYGKGLPSKIVRREVLAKLTDDLLPYGLTYVALAGGEPLLHPDIIEIINDLYKKNLDITLVSNGTYLRNYINKIGDKLFRLVISIDAIDSNMYQSIRGANAFEHIMSVVKYIKKAFPSLHITFAVVVQKKKFRHLPQFIELALNAQVDRVSYLSLDIPSMTKPHAVGTGAFGHLEPYSSQNIDEIFLSEADIHEFRINIIPQVLEKVKMHPSFGNKSLDMLVDIANYYEAFRKGLTRNEYRRCGLPFNEIAIDEDENLRFCFFTPERWNYDLKKDPVNHSEAVSARKDYLNNDNKCQKYCSECLQTVRLPTSLVPAAAPPNGISAYHDGVPDKDVVLLKYAQP